MVVAQHIVQHMGSLHPVEQLLTLVLAFGPFVVLGGVIWWRRRTDADAGADAGDDSDARQLDDQLDR
jgi:uncharacterized iron-regulated membrane protein